MSEHGLPESLPGFDDPLGLLRACHDRMLAHCDLLEALVARARAGELQDSAPRAAADIARYFSTSAPLHHRDEEEDLFPRINRQSLRIAELVHSLRKEHRALDALWATILPELRRIPADGFSGAFLESAARFSALCRAHVNRENRELLPLVASSVSTRELGYIGESMARRRGVPYQAQ